jgi:hypothetical protein
VRVWYRITVFVMTTGVALGGTTGVALGGTTGVMLGGTTGVALGGMTTAVVWGVFVGGMGVGVDVLDTPDTLAVGVMDPLDALGVTDPLYARGVGVEVLDAPDTLAVGVGVMDPLDALGVMDPLDALGVMDPLDALGVMDPLDALAVGVSVGPGVSGAQGASGIRVK